MNILVIRLSSIGDIILITPFLRSLRRRHPHAHIDVAVMREYAPLLEAHPHVDGLVPVDRAAGIAGLRALNAELRTREYDLVCDLHNSHRSRVLRRGVAPELRVLRKRPWRWMLLVGLGIDFYGNAAPIPERYLSSVADPELLPDGGGCEIALPAAVEEAVGRSVAQGGWTAGGAVVGICPGARHATKRWPEDHFLALATGLLRSTDLRLLVFGDAHDAETGRRIEALDPTRITSLCGTLSLQETAAWMDVCRVVVTNDSGLMHLATARRRPVVAIFGSTVKQFGFAPYHTPDSVVLELPGLRCRPCTHIGRSACPKGHLQCLVDITPAMVRNALAAFIPDTKA